jgi:hypothetical protein
MKTLKFSRITNFTGRNGFMKCAGIEVMALDHSSDILLSAMTSRWAVARCDIYIPKEDVVAVCELLLKEAGIEPIRIPSIPIGAMPVIGTRTDMQKMAAAKCREYGYEMAPGWSSYGEVSPPDQLSLFTCTVTGKLSGDDPGEHEVSFEGHTPREAIADLEHKLILLGQ